MNTTTNKLRERQILSQDNEFTNLKAKAFILEKIDLTGYELETTPQNVYKTFLSEQGYMIERIGTRNALKEWLMGLPSCIDLPFYYDDVNEVLNDNFNALIYKRVTKFVGDKWESYFIQDENDTKQYNRFLDIIIKNLLELAEVND